MVQYIVFHAWADSVPHLSPQLCHWLHVFNGCKICIFVVALAQ